MTHEELELEFKKRVVTKTSLNMDTVTLVAVAVDELFHLIAEQICDKPKKNLDVSQKRAEPKIRAQKHKNYKHLKTGHVYRCMGFGFIEARMEPCVIYEGPDNIIWVRPREEFEDGRFVEHDWNAA